MGVELNEAQSEKDFFLNVSSHTEIRFLLRIS
jgi:hypothetical protein